MTTFGFDITHTDGAARAGRWTLPRGVVETPCFMPVGTQGTVKGLSPGDLERHGAQIILGNTYHLHLRPGEETIAKLGGLNGFMAWPKPILTDSGGFQVFSLEGLRTVSEEGVEFRSHVDGSTRFLSPEKAMEVQWALHPDVAMAFDHVIPGKGTREQTIEAHERTLRWLARCRKRHAELRQPATGNRQPDQTLVPIIQGGVHKDLRRASLEGIMALGEWRAIAVGGLSVGEPKDVMYDVLADLETVLPRHVPRYLMGVGFPADIVAAIGLGMDLADCVAPTRMGRHGTAFTDEGQLNMGGARYKDDGRPVDEGCDCETCRTFSRGYIRHLFNAGELLGLRLLALHNVRYLIRLAERARAAIVAGSFSAWSRDWLARYTTTERS